MNSKLTRLDKIPVSSYITNIVPGNTGLDPNGSLVIFDTTGDPNLQNIISSDYGFFVDDTFIGGGYGFRTLDEYNTFKQKANLINDIPAQIEQLNRKIQDRDFSIRFVDQNKMISPEYNTYGFVTSYQYFDIQSTGSNSYTLNLNIKDNFTYLTHINITNNSLTSPSFENNDTIPYTIEFMNNVKTSTYPYNEQLKIYCNDTFLDRSSNIHTGTLTRDTDTTYSKDLDIKIVNNENKVIYSYFIPNFGVWYGRYYAFPRAEININYGNYLLSNYLNFRDTEFSFTSSIPSIQDQISNLLSLVQVGTSSVLEFEFEKEFNVTFNSGDTPLYDYLVFNRQYGIDFYFNGMKSQNWKCQRKDSLYIWQSPQQYKGEHIWKIKIHPTS